MRLEVSPSPVPVPPRPNLKKSLAELGITDGMAMMVEDETLPGGLTLNIVFTTA